MTQASANIREAPNDEFPKSPHGLASLQPRRDGSYRLLLANNKSFDFNQVDDENASMLDDMSYIVRQSREARGLPADDADTLVALFRRVLAGPPEAVPEIVHFVAGALAAKAAGAEITSPSKPPIPKIAPIRYAERSKSPDLANANVIDFVRAVYGPWLDGTLTLRALRKLDDSAVSAIYARKQPLPSDILLPTKSQEINETLRSGEAVREARRLVRAHDRRQKFVT